MKKTNNIEIIDFYEVDKMEDIIVIPDQDSYPDCHLDDTMDEFLDK